MNHWNELCQYPEIAGQLRLIYNVINMKKDELVNILDKYNPKNIIDVFQPYNVMPDLYLMTSLFQPTKYEMIKESIL